jgi:hypothetical protein
MAVYAEQQCFKFEWRSEVYYARLPENLPGVYVIVWAQGELHGNGYCASGDDYKVLPILEHDCETFQHNLIAMWKIVPVVLV